MNTRIPLILLIGSVAASPAWAAAQATATPDAQAQAAGEHDGAPGSRSTAKISLHLTKPSRTNPAYSPFIHLQFQL